MVLPEFADRAYIPESIVFDAELIPSRLVRPIRTFETTLAMFQNLPEHSAMVWPPIETIEVDLVIEEVHTATELLLRTALHVRSASFDQMVQRGPARLSDRAQGPPEADPCREQHVKHHGQNAPRFSPDLYPLVMNTAGCCHLLLEQIVGTVNAK